jgi:molecular chaperone DnaJ
VFEREGDDLLIAIPASFAQLALGATIEVPTLDGRADLEIPQGTQSGDVFRLHRRGMPDPRRGGVGDLLVQTYIEVPKKLTQREEELLRELAELENANVTPHRKSFLEKLASYFTGDQSER